MSAELGPPGLLKVFKLEQVVNKERESLHQVQIWNLLAIIALEINCVPGSLPIGRQNLGTKSSKSLTWCKDKRKNKT